MNKAHIVASEGAARPDDQRGAPDPASELPAAAPSPLVSVVVPTYNRVRQLRELLRSLELQQWRPLEIIVVDDGSTDPVPEDIGADWETRPELNLRILRQTNQGAAAARNNGFSASRGDYVYFVDSDDVVERDGIRRMAEALERLEAPYCVGQIRCVDAEGKALPMNEGNFACVDHETILGSRWAVHGALYRRRAFEAAGGFDERLRRGEDTEMRWRIIASNPPGVMVGGIVAEYRRHDEGQATYHRSCAEAGRSVLGSVEAFCAWAETRGCLRPPIARRAVWLLTHAAIRLGAAGDREGQSCAVQLALHLVKKPHDPRRCLIGLADTESRTACRCLELLSRLVRLAVHMRRSRMLRREGCFKSTTRSWAAIL